MPPAPSAVMPEDADPGSRYVLAMWNANLWLTAVWANSGRLCAISRFKVVFFAVDCSNSALTVIVLISLVLGFLCFG
jgi:hypothetical protein